MKRIDKTNYYLDIAETVSERSTCLKKHWGAIIVNNDEIISTGYNGAPRGRSSCLDTENCIRKNIKRGQQYQLCKAVHAEQNAIISAPRKDMIGAELYLIGKEVETNSYVLNSSPCIICKKLIINSGITKVIVRENKDNFNIIDTNSWLREDDEEDYLGY